jgi:hypothetical protein
VISFFSPFPVLASDLFSFDRQDEKIDQNLKSFIQIFFQRVSSKADVLLLRVEGFDNKI